MNRKNALVYSILVVLLITYGLEGAYYALFGLPDINNTDPIGCLPYFIFSVFIMWVPGMGALFFAKKEGIRLKIFQKPDWTMVHAVLIAIGLYCVAVVVSIPYNEFKEAQNFSFIGTLSAIGEMLFSSIIFLPLICLGEEVLWRGYLHEKLKHLGIFKASMLIGTIWGIWHVPMILMGHNFPGFPLLGPLFMCLLCIAGSPLFFWVREQGKSLFVPALLHATMNGFSTLSLFLFKDPNNPFLSGSNGVGVLVIWSLVSFWLLFRAKRTVASIGRDVV